MDPTSVGAHGTTVSGEWVRIPPNHFQCHPPDAESDIAGRYGGHDAILLRIHCPAARS